MVAVVSLLTAAALEPLGMCLIGESAEHAAFGVGHMPYLSIRLAAEVAGDLGFALARNRFPARAAKAEVPQPNATSRVVGLWGLRG